MGGACVICIDGVGVRRKADGPGAGTPELRQRHDPIMPLGKTTFSTASTRTSRLQALGSISRSSSSRFAVNSVLTRLTPVRLPPGRARLAARPCLTSVVSVVEFGPHLSNSAGGFHISALTPGHRSHSIQPMPSGRNVPRPCQGAGKTAGVPSSAHYFRGEVF
jgi:hypothetical protein